MDRYKFRGKRLDNGEWVEGWLLTNKLSAYIITEDNPHECLQYGYITIEQYYRVDVATVGQYTGLKDIEQFDQPKYLYSSDIVKMHQFLFDGTEYENEIIGVLEYDEELACVCLTRIKQDDIKKHMGYDDQEEFEAEKIPICTIIGLHECSWTYLGNIHDNPELLEG